MVNVVARFMLAPQVEHFKLAKHIFKHAGRLIEHGILFRHETNVILAGYMDVDWARGLEIQQLTLGIILKFWYTLVMWNNKLKSTMVFLNTKTECHSLCDGVKDII